MTWLHEPRGGYGYTFPTPATVVRVTDKRVVIDVRHATGRWKRIAVRPERISQRKP